ENKDLNIFNTSCVLASKETTTDAGFQRVEAVVAHEYFHNWTGNRITCRDWFQLSLKEGFTVLRDSQFSADQNSPTIKRIEDVNVLRTMQFAEDAGPMAHPVRPDSYIEISNFYTLTVYEKGAAVVGMIHTLLGPERFRKGSDLYFERHDGEAVTCDDFVAAMEEASGVDLQQFRLWYSQAGTPRVEVEEHYDDVTLDYRLTLRQSCPATPGQPEKQPFHIPVAVGLIGQDGIEMLGDAGRANGFDVTVESATEVENPKGDGTLVLHLKEAEQTFLFRNVPARPVLSFLRDFSAPIRVGMRHRREDLIVQMASDADGFARWDAAQTFFSELILERVANPEQEFDNRLEGVVGRLLEAALLAPDDGEAKALLAALLTLPAEEYLGQQMHVVDVAGLHAAREGLRERIGTRFAERLLAIFEANREGDYTPDAVGFARRTLCNLALAYLVLAPEGDGLELAEQQYKHADNMTDRLAALRVVAWSKREAAAPVAERLLADFLDRYRSEALVVDQWFATQALSAAPGTLGRVKALTKHEAFDARNPNKIRSLVGAFCSQNPVCFHAEDGSGYAFLVDWVIDLNASNPQIGARLLTPLTRWQRYDEARQAKMRAALERVAAVEDLSRDIYEVVSKSLKA
ncbi:MAG: aminopeptidase N, partial [Gammaproteobacteria bacterium]